MHGADVPVVSIGNLTTGGTGKTPFAAHLARWFRANGVRVCFVSRGYKSADGSVNDEALVLAQLCPDVPHLQNPDRVTACATAVHELETQLVILDDGFQHRRLRRDLDIVLIDALNPWGYGYLLPRGLLREPRSSLRRADVIVVTRVNQATDEQLRSIRARIARDSSLQPIEVSFPATRLVNATGEIHEVSTLIDQPLAVFCGIGNPQGFRESLLSLGLNIAAQREFPDHHRYTREDVTELSEWIRDTQVAAVIVTQKDLVKLKVDRLGDVPLWALEIGCEVSAGESVLNAALNRVLDAIAKDDCEA